MQIKPESLTFWQLIQGRLFRIPDYQRAYSWRTKQRRELFNDLLQLHNKEHDFHFMATVVGLRGKEQKIGTDVFNSVEVVDGQQRLTTLVLLIKAIELALPYGKDKSSLADVIIKNDDHTLLLLQTNHDYQSIYTSFVRDGITPKIRVRTSQADQNLVDGVLETQGFLKEWRNVTGKDLTSLLAIIKNKLVFLYHEINDEKLVYTVFEVLNSRGLPVAWLDRTKAVLMGVVFESAENSDEMTKELHQIWSRIYRALGLKQGLSSEALRFAATLWDEQQANRVYSEEQSLEVFRKSVQSDMNHAINISEHLLKTTETLDRLAKDKSLAAVTKVSQARFLAAAIIQVYGHNDSHKASQELEVLLNQWERVSFRIFGFARKDSRTKVGEYVRLAKHLIATKPTFEHALGAIKELGEDYPIEQVLKEFVRQANAYEGWQEELLYFMYAREKALMVENRQINENEEWNSILSASLSDTIEHIYPQKAQAGHWSSFKGKDKEKTIHQLGNLVLLPPKLNSKLSNKPFADKQTEYRKVGLQCLDEVNKYSNNHAWSPESIKRRQADLLDWAKQRWDDVKLNNRKNEG